MAGAYPNAPKLRMAYDDDGSVCLISVGTDAGLAQGLGPISTPYSVATTTEEENVNDEDLTTQNRVNVAFGSLHFAILFPEKRELDGIYVAIGNVPSSSWSDYSDDQTNGLDGTWNDLSVPGVTSEPADGYRDNIISKAISNVLAVRHFQGRNQASSSPHDMKSIHLYGTITPGETPDRLLFLDPDNADAEFTLPLDYGDVPRGQTSTDTFKVKNNSGSLTANTVQTTGADLFGGSGSWYTYSDDDITYSATLGLGNLGPGATKLVHIKQIVPDAQAPAVHAARTKLNVASWT